MNRHLSWPVSGKESALFNYTNGPLRRYIDEVVHPFENELGQLFPNEYFIQSDAERRQATAAAAALQSLPAFRAEEDVGVGVLFLEPNGYDFTDTIPHVAIVWGPATPGRRNELSFSACVLGNMPDVSIFKPDGSLFFQGLLSPKSIATAELGQAIRDHYPVIIHTLYNSHRVLGPEILARPNGN
jgi:hypothetical protein